MASAGRKSLNAVPLTQLYKRFTERYTQLRAGMIIKVSISRTTAAQETMALAFARRTDAAMPWETRMSFRRTSMWLSLAVVFSFCSLLGCGSSSNPTNPAQVRIMNASPVQQNISLLVDNITLQTDIVSQSAGAYTPETPGSHTVQVEATSSTSPLVTQNLTFNSGSSYTLLAAEPSFASSSLTLTSLTDDNSAPTSGNLKLRIINASPDFGNLDAYVATPGAGISGSPSVSNLAFQAASSYMTLPAGNYEVYFTVTGRQVISVDSGQFSFSSGQIRTLVLVDNFGSGYTSALLADLN